MTLKTRNVVVEKSLFFDVDEKRTKKTNFPAETKVLLFLFTRKSVTLTKEEFFFEMEGFSCQNYQ